MPRSRRHRTTATTVVFATLAVAVLLSGLLAFNRLGELADAANAVERSHQILRTLDRSLLRLASAESAMRGYLLTNQDSFRERLTVDIQHAAIEADTLVELTAPDPALETVATALHSWLDRRLDEIGHDAGILDLERDGAARARSAAGAVTEAMTRIPEVAEQIRAAEETRFATLERRVEAAREASRTVLGITMVIAIGMGILAVVNVAESGWRRRQLEAEIAERVAAEERVKASERELTALADSMPQLVWAANAAGEYDYLNRRWYEYTGMAPDAPMADWRGHLHPDDVEHATAEWTRCARDGDPYKAEYRLGSKEGGYRWFMGRAVPLRDRTGAVVRWFGTSTDIDEEKRLSAECDDLLERERIARSEAERESRLKDEFVATVSHELRTPLNTVLGWARILRKDRTPETLDHGLEAIERSAESQARLVDDLLDTSRALSGNLRLEMRPVALDEIVAETVETIRPAADAKDLELTMSITPARVTPTIVADPTRIRQVIWNLASNAIKFTPRGGRVSVDLARVDGSLRLTVEDTGQGIEPQFLAHVFDRFRQGDGSTTRRHSGLGLGLAVVKHLVELHGGAVVAESDGAGLGARFVVDLPIVAPSHLGAGNRPSPDQTTSTILEGVDVLVVDDDADSRELLARVLRDSGAQPRLAASVAEALDLFRESPPAAIVSDIGMPEQDGIDLIRRVRELEAGRERPTPALALSAFARPEDHERSTSAGFDIHIVKPVEPGRLALQIAQLIEERDTPEGSP